MSYPLKSRLIFPTSNRKSPVLSGPRRNSWSPNLSFPPPFPLSKWNRHSLRSQVVGAGFDLSLLFTLSQIQTSTNICEVKFHHEHISSFLLLGPTVQSTISPLRDAVVVSSLAFLLLVFKIPPYNPFNLHTAW